MYHHALHINMFSEKEVLGAGEMAQQVKVLAVQACCLSLIPRTRVKVERDKIIL